MSPPSLPSSTEKRGGGIASVSTKSTGLYTGFVRGVGAGLSLVQVLVVMGILMLLAAVVSMPVVRQAAHYAKIDTCLMNLDQLYSAIHIYAVDNDDRLPPMLRREASGLTADISVVKDGLAIYESAWHCPLSSHIPVASIDDGGMIRGIPVKETSYGFGLEAYSLDPKGKESGAITPRPLSQMRPEYPLLFDVIWSGDHSERPSSYQSPHGNVLNVLYVAGNAKIVRMDKWISTSGS